MSTGLSLLRSLLLVCVLTAGSIACASAQESEADPVIVLPAQDTISSLGNYQTGVWLVTYGPGELYWQSFGHNGIWIRDQDLGLDHVFNFGFFDFEQENFFLRFLLGKMLYFSAAQPVEREFAQYIDENRSIQLQKLALNQEQALRLADYLVRVVQPENRDYLYDYYLDNCSTRVRDALDFAVGGQLKGHYSEQAAVQSYRDHTRRLTAGDFWLYLGLELGLGRPVDGQASRWDEFFIPAELASGMTAYRTISGSSLLEEDVMLFQSSLQEPPVNAPMRWPVYGLVSLFFLVSLALLGRRFAIARPSFWCRGWLLIAGFGGVALAFFWFGTNHSVAASNLNLLLFNPLFLLVLVRRFDRPVSWLVFMLGLLALLQSLLPVPPGQYSADVVAALLPVNLVAAWALFRLRL